MNKYLINTKSIEDLTEWQSMILSIKGAVEEIKKRSKNRKFLWRFYLCNY